MMKDRILQLDYDGASLTEVLEDADMLQRLDPRLGYALVKLTKKGWHLVFPKSRLSFAKALKLAERTRCDREWLKFCGVAGCMALRVSRKRQDPEPEFLLEYDRGSVKLLEGV